MIQIPIFIALYWMLLSSVKMRGAPWILWITDLSVKDPYYILPLVMALTILVQTALNPLPPDPMQARMMWLMPLVFSVMFFFFPSGLVLYWITNNILTIAQQWSSTRAWACRRSSICPSSTEARCLACAIQKKPAIAGFFLAPVARRAGHHQARSKKQGANRPQSLCLKAYRAIETIAKWRPCAGFAQTAGARLWKSREQGGMPLASG